MGWLKHYVRPDLGQSSAELTHEASGVGGVGADLSVDLHQTLHDDLGHLGAVQGVLQAISQEDQQGQRLTQLVGTSGWTWGEDASQLVQHPCLGGG